MLLYTSHFQRIVKDAGRGGVWVEIGLVGLGVGGHQRMHRKKNLIMPSFSIAFHKVSGRYVSTQSV